MKWWLLILAIVVITYMQLSNVDEDFAKTNYQFWSYDPNKLPVEFERRP